jgi:hypothetical protein
MKKALALTLVLAMFLSILAIPALAAATTIKLNKTNYDPAEEIIATINGNDNGCILGVWKKGTAYIDSISEAEEFYGEESEVAKLRAPLEIGEYEVRLYDGDYGLMATAPFIVGKAATAKTGSISLNKTAYTAFETILVTVSGITEQRVNTKAFVQIYEKGAKHDNPVAGSFVILTKTDSTVELFAPNKNGEFEMRL